MIIFSGEVNDDISFSFESDTVVDGSCTAYLEDEMFVIGGFGKSRQVNITFEGNGHLNTRK